MGGLLIGAGGRAWARRCSALLVAAVVLGTAAGANAADVQGIELAAAGGFGGGVSLAPGGGGDTVVSHTPLFVELDISGVLDGDTAWEYAGAVSVPFETSPGLAVTPRLRRMRERWGLRTFLQVGAQVFVAPRRMAGVELGLGAWYPLLPGLEVGGQVLADVFFAGADVPDEGSLVMFNLVGGARLPL